MPRFSNPQAAIANKAKSNSTRQNAVESDIYLRLNNLDDDRSRMELIFGLASPFDVLAAVNYSSNRVVVDGESIIKSIGRIDAAMGLDTGNVKTTAAVLTGTVTTLKDSVTVTVVAATNIFTASEAHNFTAGQPIRLKTTGSLPGGITTGTTYYVGNLTGTTFMLYTSSALAVAAVASTEIDITSTGTGTHSLNGSYVLGTGTNFVLALAANDYIYIDDLASKIYQVSTIENDTTLIISSATATGGSSSVIRRLDTVAYPIIFTGLPRLKSDATNSEEPVRLGQIAGTLGTYLQKTIVGKRPYYNDAASLILPSGLGCFDSTGTLWMQTTGAETVSLASSGANGLDTGSEAVSTKYYVYLIGDSTGVNATKGLFSVTNENVSGSITLPSGYDKKRQLPLAIVNDASSNQIPWFISGAWACFHPRINYPVFHRGEGTPGTAGTTEFLTGGSSSSFAATSAAAYIPAISRFAYIQLGTNGSQNGVSLRATGESHNGIEGSATNSGAGPTIPCNTDANQSFNYKALDTSTVWLSVAAYDVTEL